MHQRVCLLFALVLGMFIIQIHYHYYKLKDKTNGYLLALFCRARHIRASSRVQSNEDKGDVKQVTEYHTNSKLRDRLLNKVL